MINSNDNDNIDNNYVIVKVLQVTGVSTLIKDWIAKGMDRKIV